jgi:hypothetical protein
MRGPYGFEIIDNCQTCTAKKSAFFCQMSPKATKEFNSIKSSSAYPGGATLFLEKQDSRGVFVLCEGEVKLTISSSEGKTLILRIAKAGEVLGLMAALSGKPYEVTAETLHPCQMPFRPRPGKACEAASGYVRWSRGDQTWNKNPDAFDPRGDRGVYRQFARDRYTRPERVQKHEPRHAERFEPVDLKQGGPGTVCNGLSWHAALRFRPLAPALRPVFSQTHRAMYTAEHAQSPPRRIRNEGSGYLALSSARAV